MINAFPSLKMLKIKVFYDNDMNLFLMAHGVTVNKTFIKLSLWSSNVLGISCDSHISQNCVRTSCDNLPMKSFVT